MTDIVERLNTKAGMIAMGEKIAFGSDVDLMREAAADIIRLRETLDLITRLTESEEDAKHNLAAIRHHAIRARMP